MGRRSHELGVVRRQNIGQRGPQLPPMKSTCLPKVLKCTTGDRRGLSGPEIGHCFANESQEGALTAADNLARMPPNRFAGTRIGRSPSISRSPGPSTRRFRRATVTSFPSGEEAAISPARETIISVFRGGAP